MEPTRVRSQRGAGPKCRDSVGADLHLAEARWTRVVRPGLAASLRRADVTTSLWTVGHNGRHS